MKKKMIIATVFMMIFISCAEKSSSSQFVKINNLERDEIPEIIFLKSEKENLEMRDKEIKKQLEKEIEGKKIIIIKTIYKGNYLFSGEIIFIPKKEGDGLKVKFISSNERFLKNREKEIKERFKKSLSEIKNIKAIQSIYHSGYLIGAEIYY